MKVIINRCPNGFTLSEDQQNNLFPGVALQDIPRHDQRLVDSFEAGDRRGNGGSSLMLVEIPDNATYKVVNQQGYETLYWSESNIETV
jgi:hypothetical protein